MKNQKTSHKSTNLLTNIELTNQKNDAEKRY